MHPGPGIAVTARSLLSFICALAVIGGCSGRATTQTGPSATSASAASGTATAPTAPTAVSVSQEVQKRLIPGPGVGRYIQLTNPAFVPAAEATFLDSSDIVLGLSEGDEHRAYPVRQIAFHHIINDEVKGQPYLLTY